MLIKMMRQGITIDKKLCDRVSCGRTSFGVLLKQWILAKLLCDRVYLWAIFYATGYRVWRALPHIPVSSLVKYPPGIKGTQPIFKTVVLIYQSKGNLDDKKFCLVISLIL